MNASSYGNKYHITIFGASHAPEIGVSIEGLPKDFRLDREALQAFLNRRAPGKNEWSTARKEADEPLFTEGLSQDGYTDGSRLTAIIRNTDPHSADYDAFRSVPRPGHADYPAYRKSGQIPAGGGKWSGRMTAPLCIAGGIAKQLLEARGIRVMARIKSIGVYTDESPFNESVEGKSFPAGSADPLLVKRFQETIAAAKAAGDSVGGTVECQVLGLPVGLGEHPFLGLENRLSTIIFGIPAVKGLEFGDGFALSRLRGSEANDAYRMEDGRVVTLTNHCGGVLGGMSDGMPLHFRVAFKPTPTIAREQDSVDLLTGTDVRIAGKGRHDPCIVPRAVPVVEAAAACAVLDALLEESEESLHTGGEKPVTQPAAASLAKEETLPAAASLSGEEIEALRARIDEADQALLAAFLKRMEAAGQIAAYKKERGLPVFDPAREARLLEKIAARTPEAFRSYTDDLYRTLLRLSKDYQHALLKDK